MGEKSTGSGRLTTGLVFVFEVPGLQYPHRQALQMIVVTQSHQKLAFVGRRLYNKRLKSSQNNVLQEENSFVLIPPKRRGCHLCHPRIFGQQLIWLKTYSVHSCTSVITVIVQRLLRFKWQKTILTYKPTIIRVREIIARAYSS